MSQKANDTRKTTDEDKEREAEASVEERSKKDIAEAAITRKRRYFIRKPLGRK